MYTSDHREYNDEGWGCDQCDAIYCDDCANDVKATDEVINASGITAYLCETCFGTIVTSPAFIWHERECQDCNVTSHDLLPCAECFMPLHRLCHKLDVATEDPLCDNCALKTSCHVCSVNPHNIACRMCEKCKQQFCVECEPQFTSRKFDKCVNCAQAHLTQCVVNVENATRVETNAETELVEISAYRGTKRARVASSPTVHN
jgi:hypothetical protein